MRTIRSLVIAVACGVMVGGSLISAQNMGGMGGDKSGMAQAPVNPGATMDIIQTAVGPNMEDVTTLVAAVKAAGLVETLKGKGPFTVLAPTNAAFAKLPKGTVEDLLKPENKEKLVKILTYHVIPGNNDAKVVMSMTSAKTVQGADVKIMSKDGKVMVGNGKDGAAWATVIKPDIKCSNGTIHWIDTVLMPE